MTTTSIHAPFPTFRPLAALVVAAAPAADVAELAAPAIVELALVDADEEEEAAFAAAKTPPKTPPGADGMADLAAFL